MLSYLTTSLFDSPAHALVNTVNIVGVMGKGIALHFKRLYPAMFAEYQRLCEERKLDIGKLHVYRTPNKIIVNFPTKRHWRNPSRVEYIEAGLKAFVRHYADYGIASASFPQLGCGNGELDWRTQVQPLMERYLRDLPIPIYIHLYTKPADFVPERLDEAYRREVLRERRQVSFVHFWQDLQALTGSSAEEAAQQGLFGPRVWLDDEFLHLQPSEDGQGQPIAVYRDDLEDMWNVLRLKGTIHRGELPQVVLDHGAADWLMDLLERLDYLKPVSIRQHEQDRPVRGLQYAPPAEVEAPIVIEATR